MVCDADNYYQMRQFFIDNKYFSMQSNQVTFLVQPNFPVLDMKGKVLIDSNRSIVTQSGGTGCAISALLKAGFYKKA